MGRNLRSMLNAISLRKKVGYLIGIFLSMGTNQRWDIMGISSTASISCCFDGPKGWCPTGLPPVIIHFKMGFSLTSQPSSYWESGILQFSEAPPGPVAANSHEGLTARLQAECHQLSRSVQELREVPGARDGLQNFFFLRKK